MQGFLIMLLICSVTMSALALLYMAATPLLAKHYSVMGRYYAWLILVIGLIIPFRPQFSNPMVKVNLPGNTNMPIILVGDGAVLTTRAPNALPSAVLHITGWQIAAVVWMVGMILFLAYYSMKHYRFLRLAARWSETVTDRQALALLQTLKAQMGISQNIGLQVCGSIGSPMMLGFARPHILLPDVGFTEDELRFILKHELVHYKRKDLWYKGLVLAATAIHWFNPIVHLMAKEIGIQCELSCDAEVVRSTDADTRLSYSKTILGVVRCKSKLATALSTNFYGGKRGMKDRILSIMDTGKKKAGAAVLCGALLLTMGTGAAFAASAKTQTPPIGTKEPTMITPQLPIAMIPDPNVYAPYTAFGITISEDGTKLLYNGQPVRLFVDEKSDIEAFYLDGAGELNLSAVRNADSGITGIERMTAEKAQAYYERFFAEEQGPDYPAKVYEAAAQDLAGPIVKEGIQVGGNKYGQYQPFGITYSAADDALYFNGQRVGFFLDQPASGDADVLWTDGAGAVNVAAVRDTSDQITGVERISDEKAREYLSAADDYVQTGLDGLEERVEAKIEALYPEN